MNSHFLSRDLAGEVCFKPNYWQVKTRINCLIEQYLNPKSLSDRVADLPLQFINPQPRPWQPIDWTKISVEQIIDIDLNVFLATVKGILDTEAPIRGYTQTSRQYLQSIHSPMAEFVGGIVDDNNTMLKLGLWEKEERRHTPALIKLYQQLTQQKISANLRSPKSYQPSANPQLDLYHHGLHRIATEYSAVCLYLWIMSRTTGQIQQIFSELLQDEVNHLSKFWGFGKWLYSEFDWKNYLKTSHYLEITQGKHKTLLPKHLTSTVRRMMKVLHWESWSMKHKIELIYAFTCVLRQMWGWSNSLTSEYLKSLFASPLV